MFLSRLALLLSLPKSIEVKNGEVLGAAPTTDAAATSEWTTIVFA